MIPGAPCLALFLTLAQTPAPPLSSVALDAIAVEDSIGYFVYRYRLSNSSSSRGGVAGVNLDLSGAPGSGLVVLPATGRFINTTGIAVGRITEPMTDNAYWLLKINAKYLLTHS